MKYLEATKLLDYHSEEIQEIIQEFKDTSLSEKEKATAVYLKIRDNWRYNPYVISLDEERYKASTIAKKPDGHCVDKAVLLIAAQS